MQIPSIYFGLFMGLFVSTSTKLVQQTIAIWRRQQTGCVTNVYLYMIWIETLVNLVFSITTYLFLCGVVHGSLGFYFGLVVLWAIQTQLLSQIIANRVSLIMVNKRKSQMLKWGLFVFISAINVSVFCIWIPAHMPSATSHQVEVDRIWERVEKSLFLLIDLGLNLYFLYLLRYRLIEEGMTKYWGLFKFNAAIAVVSVTMDAVLLGMLSLPNPVDYVQFAPVAYIVKLHIELIMADMISKVVRSGSTERVDDCYCSGNHASRTTCKTSIAAKPTAPRSERVFTNSVRMDTNISGGRTDGAQEEIHYPGIIKAVTVVHSQCNKDHSEGNQAKGKYHTEDTSSTQSLRGDDSRSE